MQASQSDASPVTDNAGRVIIVLPCSVATVVDDAAGGRWLGSARIRTLPPAVPLLERLLQELHQAAAPQGRAALRLWGQTGSRPQGWVAAADPVWLEAGREQLFLHVPPPADIEPAALRSVMQDLQQSLLAERALYFETHESYAYLRGEDALPVASLPATSIDRSRPGAFMPDFAEAGAADFYTLHSEIEMSLFAHPHNVAREQRGRRPLNGLWLWGGGTVDTTAPRPLPAMFTDDPLLRGFAACSESAWHAWPGSLRQCVAQVRGSFVAAPPYTSDEQLQALFAEIGALWRERLLADFLVLFDDIAIEQARSWRRLTRFGGRARLEKLLHEQQ